MVTAARIAHRPRRDETAHWLTRRQAMDMLNTSMASLYRWESEGRLHPRKVQRLGAKTLVFAYDPDELALIPRRARTLPMADEGEITARVFEMFDEGKSVREVVLALRQTVAKVDAYKEQWLDAGGSALVISETAKIELARFVGPFDTVAELVHAVQLKLGETIEATVPDSMTDGDVERAITRTLDASEDSDANAATSAA